MNNNDAHPMMACPVCGRDISDKRCADDDQRRESLLLNLRKAVSEDRCDKNCFDTAFKVGYFYATGIHGYRRSRKLAEPWYRVALEGFLKTEPALSPKTLAAQQNLGKALAHSEVKSDALPLLEEAVRGLQALYGESDARTLRAKSDLGNVCAELGHREEAEVLYREAVNGWKMNLRTSSSENISEIRVSLLEVMNNLAVLVDETGRKEEAEGLHREALAETTFISSAPIPSPPSTNEAVHRLQAKKNTVYNLGALLVEQADNAVVSGDATSATAALYREAASLWEPEYGRDDSDVKRLLREADRLEKTDVATAEKKCSLTTMKSRPKSQAKNMKVPCKHSIAPRPRPRKTGKTINQKKRNEGT